MGEWIETTVDGSTMRNYITGNVGQPGVLVCMYAPGVGESMQRSRDGLRT